MGHKLPARLTAWQIYLGAVLAIAAAYVVLPGGTRDGVYIAVGVSSVIAVGAGIARGRIRQPGWWLIVAGLAAWTTGDALFTWAFGERFPTAADGFFLLAYPLFIVGIGLLVRERDRAARGTVLDAAIVTVPLALGLWVAFIEPLASDGAESVLSRAVSSSYPLGDAALLACLLALVLRPARRAPAYWLLASGVLALIVADVAYDQLLAYGHYYGGTWVDCGWLLMYGLFGAAALHPSAARLVEARREADVLSRRRLAVLGAAAIASAALVLVAWARGPVGLPVVAIAAVAVPLLILARLAVLVGAQRRSAAQAHYLAALVEGSDDAIVSTDLDSVVTNWNAAAERIFGYPAATAVGRKIWDLSASGRMDESLLIMERILAGDRVERFETTRLRQDGTAIDVSMTLSPIRDETGEVVGVSGIMRDVTSQRRLEAELRAAQRMEAVGQLAGGVAHDFNNLMTAVLGHTDLIAASFEEGDERLKHAERVTYAAGRAAELTRHLLAFSRRQLLREATLDLNRVVTGLADLAEAWDGEQVVLDLDADLGAVRADPGEVERLLANLVANARDAMPHGGRLTVSTRNSDFDAAYVEQHPGARPGSYVELAVADTGRGIPDEAIDHVFEPFFTTKPAGAATGAGLGLSTVYGIVKQSTGYVTAESTPGEGSVFRVFLPRVECPAQRPEDVKPAKTGPASILLVEDEHVVRELVAEMLAGVGFAVQATANAQQALEIASDTGQIDLVITDLVMPGMNGHRLAERLEEIRPGTPVLFTSGYPGDDVVREGVLGAGRRFLPKPFTADELATAARSLLAEEPAA